MKMLRKFIKEHWLMLLAVTVLFLTTAVSLSWQWFTNLYPNYARYLRYENTQALLLFAFALIPVNWLRLGRGLMRKLHLNNLWCAAALFVLAALMENLLLGGIGGAYAHRASVFLVFVVLLAAVGTVNTKDRRWLLPAFLLSIGGWLLGKRLLGGGNGFGVWIAIAVAASVLASAFVQKNLNRRLLCTIGAYLVGSVLLPLLYICVFEPAAAQNAHQIRIGTAPAVSYAWCTGNPKIGLSLGIIIVALHIGSAILLNLAAGKADGQCRHGVMYLVMSDLAFLALGLLSYLRIIPAAVLFPDSRFGDLAVLLPCLLMNSLLYHSFKPFLPVTAGDLKVLLTPTQENAPTEDSAE